MGGGELALLGGDLLGLALELGQVDLLCVPWGGSGWARREQNGVVGNQRASDEGEGASESAKERTCEASGQVRTSSIALCGGAKEAWQQRGGSRACE